MSGEGGRDRSSGRLDEDGSLTKLKEWEVVVPAMAVGEEPLLILQEVVEEEVPGDSLSALVRGRPRPREEFHLEVSKLEEEPYPRRLMDLE